MTCNEGCGVPIVRCWKERVAAGAERLKDWRILDAIVVGLVVSVVVELNWGLIFRVL